MDSSKQRAGMGSIVNLEKQPSESRLFDVDYSGDLLTGDTIATIVSSTITSKNHVAGSVLASLDSSNIGTGVVQLRISGGTDKEQYLVTVIITTTLGDTLEGDGLLNVRECE